MVFVSTKTYLNFEDAMGMPGVIFLYGAVGVLGWFFFYFLLPETENRTLEDIETHFSTKSIWDIHIERVADLQKKPADPENGDATKKSSCGVDNVAFVGN